jgi:hypothetical protein
MWSTSSCLPTPSTMCTGKKRTRCVCRTAVSLSSVVLCVLYRTGRCGRAGRPGLVMNFANPETKFVARRFGKQLGVRVRDCEVRDGRVFLKGD